LEKCAALVKMCHSWRYKSQFEKIRLYFENVAALEKRLTA